MADAGNILVVDDDESMRLACRQTLTEEGLRVQAVARGEAALELLRQESFDAVVLDLRMAGLSGLDVLRRLKADDPAALVVMITAYGTVDVAVEAMKAGAFDFLGKPFTPEELVAVVDRALAHRRRLAAQHLIESPLLEALDLTPLVGRSPAMRQVACLVRKVAPTDSTVLVYGETGVGKELVTRAIHRLSGRRDKPFVPVDCGTLVEGLFESELFGHVRGAFTGAVQTTRGRFELAAGGTIFLDEIANVSVRMQARLLRVIQEREMTKVGGTEQIAVNVRIAAATNRNLRAEVEQGRFREDLFYRLNVIPIHIPPLRERREDIRALADYFLADLSRGREAGCPRLADEAARSIEAHDWPGNVRELKNAIERAIVTCENGVIRRADLGFAAAAAPANHPPPADESLAAHEKAQILRVLDRCAGHRAKAAAQLGINRKTLREKLRRYGLEP